MRNDHGAVAVGGPLAKHERPPEKAVRIGGKAAWIAGFAVTAAALYVAYLRLSGTIPVDSDGANAELMAWDMLHGNVALHGWVGWDASFLTTELPQLAALVAVFGLAPALPHMAMAMTYTLSVLLAMVLAKGTAVGRAALARVLIAGGIMLAPQYYSGVDYLLHSGWHVGASVPLLLALLLLDRARPGWRAAVGAGLLLAWGTVGDPLTYVLGSVPLAVACGYRVASEAVAARSAASAVPRRAWVAAALQARRYEAQLAVSALASIAVAEAGLRVLGALGGLSVVPLGFRLTGARQIGAHVALTWQAVLILFGADFHGQHGLWLAAAALHLAGAALAVLAVAGALWSWFRPGANLVVQVLAGGIAANLVLFADGDMVTKTAHDLVVVLPFSAVLAARVVPRVLQRVRPPRAARRALAVIGAAVLSGYLACLAATSTLSQQPPAATPLAAFLEAHHLTYGIGGYFDASIVTVDTGERVRVRAIAGDTKYLWGAKPAWYDPRLNDATFVAERIGTGGDYPSLVQAETELRVEFGVPARMYVCGAGEYLVIVYHKNLLAVLPGVTF